MTIPRKHLRNIKYISYGVGIPWLLCALIPFVKGDFGQYGDGFGVVTSLFSGAGFIAIAYTIILQLEGLEKQREEEQVAFTFKRIDGIKGGLSKVTYKTSTGVTAIYAIQYDMSLGNTEVNHLLKYFRYAARELDDILVYSKSHIKDDTSLNLIQGQVFLVYVQYFEHFFEKVKDLNIQDCFKELEKLKPELERLDKKLQTNRVEKIIAYYEE